MIALIKWLISLNFSEQVAINQEMIQKHDTPETIKEQRQWMEGYPDWYNKYLCNDN